MKVFLGSGRLQNNRLFTQGESVTSLHCIFAALNTCISVSQITGGCLYVIAKRNCAHVFEVQLRDDGLICSEFCAIPPMGRHFMCLQPCCRGLAGPRCLSVKNACALQGTGSFDCGAQQRSDLPCHQWVRAELVL